MIVDALHKILAGENLTENEAVSVMNEIMSGEATEAQIGGFLIGMKQKGEKTEELIGFVKSMRKNSQRITIDKEYLVDGCGTGGDGSNTFNISTAASLVASASGATVAKHGNRSVSSKCGSADILEAIGGNIDPGIDKVRDAIENIGFGFLFAPRFHPSMKYAAGPRKQLKVRTFFNILGPMTNPAGVKRQVIGVFSDEVMYQMAEVLMATGSEHLLLVRSEDGLDEFSISAPTKFVELKNNELKNGKIEPNDVGLENFPLDSICGADPEFNKVLFYRLLDGEQNGVREAVLFNAGAMVYVAGLAESIKEGVAIAAEAIDNNKAQEKLNEWIKHSNS